MEPRSLRSFLGHAFRCSLAASILLAPMAGAERSLGAEIRQALPHGVSSFIVRLGVPGSPRSVTFVNENPAAEGKLSIAVAERRLAANSPHWNPVDGAIRFRHKRLFSFSLVGINANYVRLTFDVKTPERVATR